MQCIPCPPSHLTPPSHLPTLISPHSPSPHPTLPFYPAHPNLTPHSLHLSHLHLSTSPILTSPPLTHPPLTFTNPHLPSPPRPPLTSLILTLLPHPSCRKNKKDAPARSVDDEKVSTGELAVSQHTGKVQLRQKSAAKAMAHQRYSLSVLDGYDDTVRANV